MEDETPVDASIQRIETERLILRRPALGDAPSILSMLSDPQLFRYSPLPLVTHLGDVEQIIIDWDDHWDNGLRTYIATRKEAIETPIGFINIGPDEELGGALMQHQSGAGLAGEALRAVMLSLPLKRAWTVIDAEIISLIRLLEKVGFVNERTLYAHRIHPRISSQKRDCVLMRQINSSEV